MLDVRKIADGIFEITSFTESGFSNPEGRILVEIRPSLEATKKLSPYQEFRL